MSFWQYMKLTSDYELNSDYYYIWLRRGRAKREPDFIDLSISTFKTP